MNDEPSGYVPISCDIHDRIEDLATLRKKTRIVFLDDAGQKQERLALLVDVFARRGEEFLVLDTAETVRLDRLLEIGGEKI